MLNKKTNKLPKRCKSFLSRLYDILNDKEYIHIIHWNKDGNGIVISDANKLSEIVLPKYYKHNNYSSFVRQLNMYGFHKTRGIGKEGEGFEHEKFNRKSTKDQIKQMMRQNKKMKLLSKYIKANTIINCDEDSNDEHSYNNENDIFQFLLEKNEENIKNILELKNEIAALKTNNLNLYNQLQQIKDGQNIIFRKIIKNQNNKINKNHEKSKNLKELFRRYLYFLKIYSPRFMLQNMDKKESYMTEKVDSFTFGNAGTIKKDTTTNINNFNNIHNINNINVNMDSFFDEVPSFIKQRQDFRSFDFVIHNNNTSNENSFFNNNNKDFK